MMNMPCVFIPPPPPPPPPRCSKRGVLLDITALPDVGPLSQRVRSLGGG